MAEVEEWIDTAAREYNHAPVHADPYQAVGLLQRLRARGLRAAEFTFSSQSVGRVANALHLALRNRLLLLPDDPELVAELGRVRLRETAPSVVRLDHDSGQHDDQAVAIAIAVAVLQGEQQTGTGWLAYYRAEKARRAEELGRSEGSVEQNVLRPGCSHRYQRTGDAFFCVFCGGRRQDQAA